MAVWSVGSVADEPELVLRRWKAYEGEDLRYLVGWNASDREGLVSTYVATFDPVTRRVATASGSVYELNGPPAYESGAAQPWGARWQRIHGVRGLRDVTDEVWSAIQAATAQNQNSTGDNS